VLDGFMVTAGNADEPGCFHGGGIYIEESTPRLQNLFVWMNSAVEGGGGIYELLSATQIERCTVVANQATTGWQVGGGGMLSIGSSPRIVDSIFADNSSDEGGALSWIDRHGNQNLSIVRSQFLRNEAGEGGGVMIKGLTPGSARIDKSQFRLNRGKGLSLYNPFHSDYLPPPATPLLLTQSLFWGNEGYYDGGMSVGGAASLQVINSTFANNNATADFGAEVGGLSSGAIVTTVRNSVFFGNTVGGAPSGDQDQIYVRPTSSVQNSCIEGLSHYVGFGNRDPGSDPFVNAASGDLKLEAGTLCIDAGSPFVDFDPTQAGFQLPPDQDLGGKDRVVDGDGDGIPVIDMGAYEYQGG
jgi:hypothetical protein